MIAQAADPCLLPKAMKSARELAGMRAAHVRDGAALDSVPGLAVVRSARRRLERERRGGAARRVPRGERNVIGGPAFRRSRRPAATPPLSIIRVSRESDRLLTRGTLYLVDSGAQYLDGTTDVTRTVALGEPTEEMRQRFTLVLKGHIAIATARFPRARPVRSWTRWLARRCGAPAWTTITGPAMGSATI